MLLILSIISGEAVATFINISDILLAIARCWQQGAYGWW